MYYFGTNLEKRFAVPDFWPTQEQSHRIPFEKDEIKAEIERFQRNAQRRKMEEAAAEARTAAGGDGGDMGARTGTGTGGE